MNPVRRELEFAVKSILNELGINGIIKPKKENQQSKPSSSKKRKKKSSNKNANTTKTGV